MPKFSDSVHLRFPLPMLQEIDKRAAINNMTRSTYIRYIVDQYLKNNKE